MASAEAVQNEEEGPFSKGENALQHVDFGQLYETLRKEYLKPTVGGHSSIGTPAQHNSGAKSEKIRVARLGHLPKDKLVRRSSAVKSALLFSYFFFGLWLYVLPPSGVAYCVRLQKEVRERVQNGHNKAWLHSHGKIVKADKLHPAVTRVIAEWFELVDDDGSRTLEHHELLAALKAGAASRAGGCSSGAACMHGQRPSLGTDIICMCTVPSMRRLPPAARARASSTHPRLCS